MKNKYNKYDEYHNKIIKIIESCVTPEQLDCSVRMVTNFNDYYPSLKGDILIKCIYSKLEELINEK